MIFNRSKNEIPSAEEALPGRSGRPYQVGGTHLTLGNPVETQAPEGFEVAVFGLGCFWGEEKTFWEVPGVWSTSVGYAGGSTPNPTYEEVCTGRTGHAEVVRVIFDPAKLSYQRLLEVFWENHDPTQGMRQGNDVGSQYRSAVYTTTDAQLATARASREAYQQALTAARKGEITTEILPAGPFYFAEAYHQQYLDKNPGGYCNHGFNGVSCPIGVGVPASD